MDDVSIISLPDSDLTFQTLIEGHQTASTEFDNSTNNQQFNACSLFVNHWVDGTIKKDEDLRSAKKLYIEGLKQKQSEQPTETPTIVFGKKTSVNNMNTELSKLPKEIMISISSENTERTPPKSNKSDESRKRKSSESRDDFLKKKRDENYSNLVGITERRKTVHINKPTMSATTIPGRKTILIDPMKHTPNSNRHNTSASSDDTVQFGGHRLTTSSSNHTVTRETLHGENKLKSKDYFSSRSQKRSPKDELSYREARPSAHRHTSSSHRTEYSSRRPSSSSHRARSPSHRLGSSSHRSERSSKHQSSSSLYQSSNSREHKRKERRSSKDKHRGRSDNRSRLSEDKLKQFTKCTESTKEGKLSSSNSCYPENVVKAAQRMDSTMADMLNSSIKLVTSTPTLLKEIDLFKMENEATDASPSREHLFKYYKIPKNGGYSNQPKSGIQNGTSAKSINLEKSTLSSTSTVKPSATTHKPYKNEKSNTSLKTKTHHQMNNFQPKKTSTDTTASGKNTSESEKTQNVDDKNELPDVPELDDCIIPEMNPKVIINRLKFNPLNRDATVEKVAIASGNDKWIVRHENGKMKLIKEQKGSHRKSSNKKHRSATETNDEVSTNEVATANKVSANYSNQVSIADEVTTSEKVTDELATDELATDELATDELATDELATDELATSELATAHNVSATEISTAEVITDEVTTSVQAINEVANNFISNEVADVPIIDMTMQSNPSQNVEIQDNNIRIQIDSSQQTEVLTSNFGGQKNDDETNRILEEQARSISMFKMAMQEYEATIQEREHEILSHKNTIAEQQNMIIERVQIIKERNIMIAERELMIREREQKIKDFEEKVKMQDRKMYDTIRELTKLNRTNTSLNKSLNDKEKYCIENHKEKPKPKPRAIRPPISPPEITQPPNLPMTNNFSGFQNGMVHMSPQQAPILLAGNTNHLTGNSMPMFYSAPTTLQQTYYSSTPTVPQFLANSSNTFGNAGSTSTGNVNVTSMSSTAHTSMRSGVPTSIHIAALTSITNAAPTSIDNNQFFTNSPNITNTFGNTASTSIGNANVTSMGSTAPTSMRSAVPTSIRSSVSPIDNNVLPARQQDTQQIRIQGPNLEWSVDAVSNSSTSTYTQAVQPRISVSKNLYPTSPTISSETQSNTSGGMTSTSGNVPQVSTPHQMIPRQPERRQSVFNGNVNPAQQLHFQQRSHLRNRSNTYVPVAQSNFDTNNTQIWQQNHLQHIQSLQQQQVSQQPLDQSTVLQSSINQDNQQSVFFCLECYKTATLVCATCRNCSSCSEFCYDLIEPKHKSECILPNMVTISSLNENQFT